LLDPGGPCATKRRSDGMPKERVWTRTALDGLVRVTIFRMRAAMPELRALALVNLIPLPGASSSRRTAFGWM